MVGVPGRSKGCSTCRYRKKKCDELRPMCGNCIRGGFECGGYERNIILVHANDAGKGTYRPVITKDRPRLQQPKTTYGLASVARQSESLNRTSFELRCYESFWDVYLPPSSFKVASCATSFVNPGIQWAEYTHDCVPRSEVTRCALLALSTSKQGRDRRDKRLTWQGMELYGKALSLFAKEMKTPGRVKPFEVLNCCRILALYEQLNDVTAAANNWKGHIGGLLSLVRMHPPEAFSQAGAHEIFLECRYDGVTSALSNRKATFLSRPEWMSGPWKTRQKDAVDTVMDVLVKLPGVLEEWDLLSTRKSTDETLLRVRIFKKHCLSIDHELRTWYNNFASSLGPDDAEVLLRGIGSPAQQAGIPDILARIGLHQLYAMMLYWTACTILYAIIDLVYSVFPAAIDILSERASILGANILKYVVCLAHGAKYFLTHELGLLGTLSISHTTTSLVRTLCAHQICYPEVDPTDVEQLRCLMGVVQEFSGFSAWQMWKWGMDDLNYNKKAILDRYHPDALIVETGT